MLVFVTWNDNDIMPFWPEEVAIEGQGAREDGMPLSERLPPPSRQWKGQSACCLWLYLFAAQEISTTVGHGGRQIPSSDG
jgi:hypothetical protein